MSLRKAVEMCRPGAFRRECICNFLRQYNNNNKKKQQQNKILLITNISNYISFAPQIAYKLIEAGRSKDVYVFHVTLYATLSLSERAEGSV